MTPLVNSAPHACEAIADLRWRVAQAWQVTISDQYYNAGGGRTRTGRPPPTAAPATATLMVSSLRVATSACLPTRRARKVPRGRAPRHRKIRGGWVVVVPGAIVRVL